MRDVYEVLRSKELEMETLEAQIQALRIAAPLLSDDADSSHGDAAVSPRWTTPRAPSRFPRQQTPILNLSTPTGRKERQDSRSPPSIGVGSLIAATGSILTAENSNLADA